jgi:hypothetical protein
VTAVQSFDKGAQAGMKQVLNQCKRQCEPDDIDVNACSMLGKDAASEIAEGYAAVHCGSHIMFTPSHNKYKEECFEIGLDDCKGAIVDKLNLYCKGQDIDNHSLVVKGLKLMCPIKVGSFIDHTLG